MRIPAVIGLVAAAAVFGALSGALAARHIIFERIRAQQERDADAVAYAVETARAKLKQEYGYSEEEILVLKDKEIGALAELNYHSRDVEQAVFERTIDAPEDTAGPFLTYVNPDVSHIETFRGLPTPTITVSRTDSLYPRVEVEPAQDASGNDLLVLFEFDISETFDTPNYWRTPALLPNFAEHDRASRRGAAFRLQTPLETDGHAEVVDFPFRVSSMRLPWTEDGLTPKAMMQQARAVGFGLDGEDLVEEVFNYARFMYHWSNDELLHSPYDTFVSRMGECGYINQLAGTFLEFNGVRYRSVGGFNPIARVSFPGGGHTAIEVWNEEDGRWNYMDSYLNILLDGPVRLADQTDAGEKWIYDLPPELHDKLGTYLGLSELFRYRKYFDVHKRADTVQMHRLENESDYGLGWDLLVAPEFAANDLFPAEMTVHVRARYIDTDGHGLDYTSVQSGLFSPTAVASFTVPVRKLVTTQTR